MGTLACIVIILAVVLFMLASAKHAGVSKGEDVSDIDRHGSALGAAFYITSIILALVVLL